MRRRECHPAQPIDRLAALLHRVVAYPPSAAAALLGGAVAAMFVALLVLPIGWPTYLGIFGVTASGVLLYSRRRGIKKAASAAYALLGIGLAISGAFGVVSTLQRSLRSEHGQPSLTYTLKPYGSPSNVASDQGVALVRTCPHVRCVAVARLRPDDSVYMRCWITGDWFSDRYRSDRWFRIRFVYRGRRYAGFIPSSEVIGQAATPHCRPA
jgi:hypothetical protein